MNYHFNDGGRAAAGYKGQTRDCAARAMAIALELDYKTAYKEIAEANAVRTGKASVRHGTYADTLTDVLKRHGWVWQQAPKFTGRKARCSDLSGIVIARQSKHFVAVVNGIPQDIFDSSYKMVYGFWIKA